MLDYLLSLCRPHSAFDAWDDTAAELKRILDHGSVWDVTAGEDGEPYRLTRRVTGPIADAIEAIAPVSERAGQHLREAWVQLLGTQPDPSAAYQAAVAAVEVAAKPIVNPNDQGATLGRILGQLRADARDHPERWVFELGSLQVVVDMIDALWTTQLRHGDETAPISETQEQADAAVHLAVTLARWFVTGAVRRA